jgi:hypothetical protein
MLNPRKVRADHGNASGIIFMFDYMTRAAILGAAFTAATSLAMGFCFSVV